MKDLIAALQSLTLPWDAISGARIVLDGVNGRILIYNAANELILSMSPTAGTDNAGNEIHAGIASYRPPGSDLLTILMTADGVFEAVSAQGVTDILRTGTIEFSGSTGGASQSSGAMTIRIPSNQPDYVSGLIGMQSPSEDGTVPPAGFIGVEGPGSQAALCNSFILDICGFIRKNTFEASGNVRNEEWINLPLAGAWVADVETPQYKLMADGTCVLRGNLKDGATANGTTIANLPVDYRPNTHQRFITAEKQTGLAWRHIAISTGGVVTVWNCTTAHICLDGVRFPVI